MVFQFVLVSDAIMNENILQIISQTFFVFVCLGYSIVQYFQDELQAAQRIEIAIIVLMIIFALGWVLLTYRLHREFGWTIFKSYGADIKILNSLRMYHAFLVLLKLDVFFFIGFSVQYLVLVLRNNSSISEIYIHGLLAFPATFALLIVAYIAIHQESRVLMSMSLIGLSVGIGYMITKLVDLATNQTHNKFLGARKSLAWFESFTLFLAILTYILAILNFSLFGLGFREHRRQQRRKFRSNSSSYMNIIQRWEID